MFCGHCGRNIPADTRFCGACGSAVKPLPYPPAQPWPPHPAAVAATPPLCGRVWKAPIVTEEPVKAVPLALGRNPFVMVAAFAAAPALLLLAWICVKVV